MKKSEKDIISTIKYLPIILILSISFLLTLFLYTENINRFNLENSQLEKKYIDLNKDIIEFQVKKIKDTILYEKERTYKKLKTELKDQITNAYNIAMSIYNHNREKSKEEITKLIKNALRDVRFNDGRGYLFIYQRDGINILHPIKPQLENQDMWTHQDKKGTYIMQKMDRLLLEQKEDFFTWYWTKPSDNKHEYEKLGFIKSFEPFDWYIGTGEYVKDFEEDLKEKLLSDISEFRYKKEGYIFTINFDGRYLSFHDKNMVGKIIKNLNTNETTRNIFTKMINLSKSGGGFLSYKHNITSSKISNNNKISFIDGIKDWNWIIGTGFYMDDFYSQLNNKKEELSKLNNEALRKLTVGSAIVTLVLLAVFIYISSILESKFLAYRLDIKSQIDENIKKDNLLSQQSKLAAMGEMVGNIAHQWRQPLSTISVIVTGIKAQRDLGLENKNIEKESLEKINKHIQYLSQTIDDFSNFFRPNKEANSFELNTMIHKTVQLVEAQLNSKDIELIEDVENVNVISLENELIQVLINLLNNARDELVKIDGKKYIFIKARKKDENIVLTVKDNAGGISEDIINRIFEPYFTTKERSQGVGIGLFMSEEIIVKHLFGEFIVKNVEYKYQSKIQKGAEFKIIFPFEHKTKENLS